MLKIHLAERADVLADALAELLLEVPGDPFAAEVVAVPTRGIERWLTQTLSSRLGTRPGQRDGVCANVEFPFPGRIVTEALALAGGVEPERDPWLPARLVWPLIEVVESAAQEDWLDPLTRHLQSGSDQRYSRLAQVARLFDEYSVWRPELIQAWARGESGGVDEGRAAGWQPELWRRLRAHLNLPSPAERLTPACARLVSEPQVVELPPRLVLFGLTRLPASHLQVLEALASGRDVHLMLLHPSPAMWNSGEPRNRLLASWGRDVLGLQTRVKGIGTEIHHPLLEPERRDTLLEALQSDVRADRRPPGAPLRDDDVDTRLQLAGDDHSIQIHACHGRARQVEVLREAILHRLADDPTLEPRDVVVMCPDIEAFAPLIEATFGARAAAEGEREQRAVGEPPALSVRLADRSLRRTTPILAVAARLLELASSRVTASEVLDLADTGPVRARFSFDDDDLAQLRDWVASSGIHWGLDAARRAAYQLTEIDAGTWATGLRRLLLGVTMTPEHGALDDRVLPLAEVQSSQIELAGRFAEFIDRLDATLRSLAGPQRVPSWTAALAAAADALMATTAQDAWQRSQLDRLLADIDQQSDAGSAELALPELRALLGQRLEGRPTRANFRSGHLTFCTLVPMRSVPHRVVCLLGLDDGAFPRQASRDGDNLLLAEPSPEATALTGPRPGDRDPRTEDRQLLLDALLAARQALIITYSGNDERTNASLPPAVPVGELLDAVDATARVAPAGATRRARDQIVIRHPLQAFDQRNFVGAGSDPARAADGVWSFEVAALAGARAFVATRHDPPPFLSEPLAPAADADLVTLEELVAFMQRPVRAFLRQRLGVLLRSDEDEIADGLPIELDALERWGVGQRLLERRLEGADQRAAYLPEVASGMLPPGALAIPVIEEIWPVARTLADVARAYAKDTEPRTHQTNLTLPDGTRLTGAVGGIHGHVVLQVSYSRLSSRTRLAAWVRLLALSAAAPEIPFEAVSIGRGGRAGAVEIARLPQLGGDPGVRSSTAREQLVKLTALRAMGLRAPLPLPCDTALAYAEATIRGEDPVAAARRRWDSGWYDNRYIEREDQQPEHRLAFPEGLDMDRLGELALPVWRPLLKREVIDS